MYCFLYGVECGVISFLDKGSEQRLRGELLSFHMPRRFMPHYDVPKHVYVLTRQTEATDPIPEDSALVRYHPLTLTDFGTLNEWVLRTCWVYIQLLPLDMENALRMVGRPDGTQGDKAPHGTDLSRCCLLSPLPPLEQALRVALLLQAAYDPLPGDDSSASGAETPPEATSGSEQGELRSPSLTSPVSPTSPGW